MELPQEPAHPLCSVPVIQTVPKRHWHNSLVCSVPTEYPEKLLADGCEHSERLEDKPNRDQVTEQVELKLYHQTWA